MLLNSRRYLRCQTTNCHHLLPPNCPARLQKPVTDREKLPSGKEAARRERREGGKFRSSSRAPIPTIIAADDTTCSGYPTPRSRQPLVPERYLYRCLSSRPKGGCVVFNHSYENRTSRVHLIIRIIAKPFPRSSCTARWIPCLAGDLTCHVNTPCCLSKHSTKPKRTSRLDRVVVFPKFFSDL